MECKYDNAKHVTSGSSRTKAIRAQEEDEDKEEESAAIKRLEDEDVNGISLEDIKL